jgi:hypothetical protein
MTDWLCYDEENAARHEEKLSEGEDGYVDAPTIWNFWYDGDKRNSLLDATDLQDVVIEIVDMTHMDPEELDNWQIQNLVSGQVITGTQLVATYGHLYPH